MRELSTQLPTWSTGGIPVVSQTSVNPGPAYSRAASGTRSPALAQAKAEQPVCATRMSLLMSSLTTSTCTWS